MVCTMVTNSFEMIANFVRCSQHTSTNFQSPITSFLTYYESLFFVEKIYEDSKLGISNFWKYVGGEHFHNFVHHNIVSQTPNLFSFSSIAQKKESCCF